MLISVKKKLIFVRLSAGANSVVFLSHVSTDYEQLTLYPAFLKCLSLGNQEKRAQLLAPLFASGPTI